MLPGFSAIDRFVNAALGVGAVSVSQHADKYNICVVRIDHDAADLARIFQPDVVPGLSRVARFVYAVPGSEVRANVGFAGARIKNVWVGWRHFDRPDRPHWLAVKNWLPDCAGIGSSPNAAVHGAEVKSCGLSGNSGDRHRTPTAEWSNEPPAQPREKVGRNFLGKCARGNQTQ